MSSAILRGWRVGIMVVASCDGRSTAIVESDALRKSRPKNMVRRRGRVKLDIFRNDRHRLIPPRQGAPFHLELSDATRLESKPTHFLRIVQ